jgi:hypothetical protein
MQRKPRVAIVKLVTVGRCVDTCEVRKLELGAKAQIVVRTRAVGMIGAAKRAERRSI